MSNLDFPTILILAICIAAIVFLGYKMFEVYNGNKEKQELTQSNPVVDEEEEDPLNENESDTYQYNIDEADSTGVAGTDDEETTGAGNEGEISYDEKEKDEDSLDNVPASYGSSSGKYLVLAGAFSIKENADRFASELQGKGYENATAKIFDRGKLAVVLVDRFESIGEARSLVSELKKGGVEAYVQTQRASAN
jgi:cell division protein FtsN